MNSISVMRTSPEEADRFINHPETQRLADTYDITFETSPSTNFALKGETWVNIMVEADTETKIGIGKGFILALGSMAGGHLTPESLKGE